MKKVGICGVYGEGPEFLGGQPVKVRMITEELIGIFGKDEIQLVNTYKWSKNPIRILNDSFKMFKNCENILMMPAHNGIKVFTPLFTLFNIFFNRKIHYIVIGGWLPRYLNKYLVLKKLISRFQGVYVETNSMKRDLNLLGMNNIYIMNNFKKLLPIDINKLELNFTEPYKLCIFSRVVSEKGIEDAFNTVININNIFKREVYSLDIYGFIDENYKNRFNEIIKEAPPYIKYCGVVDADRTVKVLRDYFLHIFPTRFKTEGVPGSIIDSYYAGLPVLASRWNSFSDVIEEGKTGIGFEILNPEDLKIKLIDIANNPEIIIQMKKNCIKKSIKYSPEYVIKRFLKHLY